MSCSRVRRDRDREDRCSEGGRHSVDEKRRNVMWRVMTASSVPTVPWLTTPNKSSKAREILFVDEEDVKKFGVRGDALYNLELRKWYYLRYFKQVRVIYGRTSMDSTH